MFRPIEIDTPVKWSKTISIGMKQTLHPSNVAANEWKAHDDITIVVIVVYCGCIVNLPTYEFHI